MKRISRSARGMGKVLVSALSIAGAVAVASGCATVQKAGTAGTGEVTSFASLVMQPLPDWAKDGLEEGLYLDIEEVMRRERLTRFQAVEVQSQMRESMFADPALDAPAAYARALTEVRAGRVESGWKPVEFKRPGEFVLVLDGDETLFKHWYGSWEKGNYDLAGITPDVAVSGRGERVESSAYIKFTPGVEAFIHRMRRNPLCRGIVLFSGKRNLPTRQIMEQWRFSNGQPALRYFSGVFGRSHMVLGKRIVVPSKDLRIVDPELKHVVLVDDNPSKVVQQQLIRAQPKFDADRYFQARQAKDPIGVAYYESLLPNAADEIEEVAAAAERQRIPFSQAFLPYSYSGERVYRTLNRTLGRSTKAMAVTRARPELQDATFRPERDAPKAN